MSDHQPSSKNKGRNDEVSMRGTETIVYFSNIITGMARVVWFQNCQVNEDIKTLPVSISHACLPLPSVEEYNLENSFWISNRFHHTRVINSDKENLFRLAGVLHTDDRHVATVSFKKIKLAV